MNMKFQKRTPIAARHSGVPANFSFGAQASAEKRASSRVSQLPSCASIRDSQTQQISDHARNLLCDGYERYMKRIWET
jgi:hypothetical protein